MASEDASDLGEVVRVIGRELKISKERIKQLEDALAKVRLHFRIICTEC